MENGPQPTLPILPVAKCALMIALPLSTPFSAWLTPWQKSVIAVGLWANHWKNVVSLSCETPTSVAKLVTS